MKITLRIGARLISPTLNIPQVTQPAFSIFIICKLHVHTFQMQCLWSLSPGLWVYAGCPSRAHLPTAHCLSHLCVGSALHRGTSLILSPGTVLLHCYYSASYLIALFCPGGVAGPLNADCYPTAPSLLCGWSDGLEWSTGCAASGASSPLGSFSF